MISPATKKNILFVLPFIPYPLESGGHQALFNGIKAVKDDYNVLVAYEAIDNEAYRQNEVAFLEALPGIKVLPLLRAETHLSKSQKLYQWVKQKVKQLLGIKSIEYVPEVYEGWISRVSPLNSLWGNHLDAIFAIYQIDVVQVEMPWMIGTVYNLPASIKKVFVHHEIAFVRNRLELGDNPSMTAVAHADFTKMLEIYLLNKYDAVVTLSQADKQKLMDAGVTAPIYSSFAVVDDAVYRSPDIVQKVISFVGPDYHNPNYEGVLWFLNNCWSRLKSVDDSYRLHIIGRWTDKSVDYVSAHFKDVEFLGYVDDLGKALRDTVMIVPIHIGSGIRMKILEAASMGVPVVSTSVGAEGLPITDGVQCFIKDTPDEFVDGILSLQRPELAISMCEAAHEMVSEFYSLSVLRENRQGILKELYSHE